ncbi:HNH endonuclease signature motif containing protein [Methylobacterium nodulans]|uniref:HNH endonuclease n=1 Tax=Methylobacterium nodulans TaxID=114616 RepID=UPI003137D7D8
MTDLDVYTPAEIEVEPVFRDFLRPRGLGWGVASAVTVPSGDRLIFNVERAFARGPVTRDVVARLDALRPHLARAATMSARLRLQTVRAAAQALDVVGVPAAILGRQLQVLAVNAGCEALFGYTVQEARRFALTHPEADNPRTARPMPKTADAELQTPEHRAWRLAVLQRAGWCCEDCGAQGGRGGVRLFADHVIERQDGGALTDPNNGRCLCGSCHTRKTVAERARRMAVRSAAAEPGRG